jgi:hypothetical protein
MSKPLNAFIPEIFRWLVERDFDLFSAAEAEVAGPWKVLPLSSGGCWSRGRAGVGRLPRSRPGAELTASHDCRRTPHERVASSLPRSPL